MVYPPGIPIFIPGEIITEDNLSYIKKNMEAGLPVQGPEDFDFKMLRVIKEHQAITIIRRGCFNLRQLLLLLQKTASH